MNSDAARIATELLSIIVMGGAAIVLYLLALRKIGADALKYLAIGYGCAVLAALSESVYNVLDMFGIGGEEFREAADACDITASYAATLFVLLAAIVLGKYPGRVKAMQLWLAAAAIVGAIVAVFQLVVGAYPKAGGLVLEIIDTVSSLIALLWLALSLLRLPASRMRDITVGLSVLWGAAGVIYWLIEKRLPGFIPAYNLITLLVEFGAAITTALLSAKAFADRT